ncbi:hypothetical protein QOZ80_3BG0281850 [Eleusine coracana subsp. coracana]|nr:hypothetical protein QOZ80_3BG0281850 [Eleusine coracana subsp. coracana]
MLHLSLAAATAAASSSYASPPLQVSASPSTWRRAVAIRCAANGSGAPAGDATSTLKIGSPIVILKASTMLKTAASVRRSVTTAGKSRPAMSEESCMARKPTYLLDNKYFRPLDVVDGDDKAPAPADE